MKGKPWLTTFAGYRVGVTLETVRRAGSAALTGDTVVVIAGLTLCFGGVVLAVLDGRSRLYTLSLSIVIVVSWCASSTDVRF